MIDATFCNAVSLLTGFTGWVLAVWSFLRPERDRSGWRPWRVIWKRPWSRPPAQLSPAGSCL